jgi:hypothetical protein
MSQITSKHCLLLFGVAVMLCGSCRKDFDYPASTGNLSFSKDTVYLDTVFSNISSSTYALKVYNKSKNDVQIPSITLANGAASNYRINVDGQAGKAFFNVPLFAKDSLYIFIEATVDISTSISTEFLYTDALIFDSGSNEQKVALVTLVKDAVFLYPKKNGEGIRETIMLPAGTDDSNLIVEGFTLDDNQLNFTNEKPYVIYGYATVPENKTLTIAAGARVYFHQNSGLFVQKNSSLFIDGQLSEDKELLENEVIFQGDRLEPDYAKKAGQWGTIWIDKDSNNNRIIHLTLKNATIGIFVKGSNTENFLNLKITNTQIYNSSNTNLWGQTAQIEAENLVLGNAGYASLYLNNGGRCRFTHCTIANYWSKGFRMGAALQIDASLNQNLQEAAFNNCIVDGSKSLEIQLNNNSNSDFNFSFTNCMLKATLNTSLNNNPLYNFIDTTRYQNVFLNENAAFVNSRLNNYTIQENSFAIAKGNVEGALAVPKDLNGKDRKLQITLGAYQF